MATKVVSTAEPTLHLTSKLNNQSPKNQTTHSTISFTSQFTPKPTISTRNQSGPDPTRGQARISAFYADPARTTETLYEVLGVSEAESTPSDIKKAYKRMARTYHPDVSPPDRVDEYTRRFIMVHEAYETLSDPETRASYDRDLVNGFGSSSGLGSRKPRQYHQQGMDEKGEWKTRWESQLDELKRKGGNRGRVSWGARMRNQTCP